MMHVPLGDTYHINFTTRQFSTGAPFTLAGTPTFGVYEDGSTTQVQSAQSVTADFDSVTGLNLASVVATSGNGYEVGKYYAVVLDAGTVDSVSVVGEVVGHFRVMPAEDAGAGIPDVNITHISDSAVDTTSAQIGVNIVQISEDATAADNLELMYDGTGYTDDTAPASRAQVSSIGAASGGAVNFANEADNVDSGIKSVTFVGVETSGTNASANAEDATYHQIDDTGNAIDIVYQYDIGGSRTATEVTWVGRLISLNDTITVQAYNGSGWDTIGTIAGESNSAPSSVTDNATEIFPLLTTHTGSGADLGKVYIRFVCSGQTNPTLYSDQILVSAVASQATIGYVGGAVWIDTGASNTNTESYVDGTADNPVSTIAAATTIAGNLNLKIFNLLPGSSITLAQAYDNYEFIGYAYTIALGGQSISGTSFTNATISGNDDGSNATKATFIDCVMGDNSLGNAALVRCGLGGTSTGVTLAEAVTYDFDQCYSRVAGTNTPLITFGTGNQNLNMRHYSGGIQVEAMGDNGTDTMTLEGFGQFKEGTCTGGTVAIRGTFTTSGVTNLTLSDDARLDVAQINAECDTAISDVFSAAHAEPSGVPAANETPLDKLGYLFMALRNKVTVTATKKTFFDDSDSAEWEKDLTDDGSTYTETEGNAP
jgi:hypothetical protein